MLRAEPPLVLAEPLVAVIGHPVTVNGARFGRPREGSEVILTAGAHEIRIPSTSSAINRWQRDAIDFLVPLGLFASQLRVRTPNGTSEGVALALFAYEAYPVPATPGANPHPLAIAVDAAQRVWINQEFSLHFAVLDPADGRVLAIEIPRPPSPGPFGAKILSDGPTAVSVLGEDILAGPLGRVWLSQGGGFLYDGKYPNHSRIVSYRLDPGETSFEIFNVPGDRNEVKGLAWDARRGRIWFTEGTLGAGARLTSFDPQRVSSDNDFSESVDHPVCAPDGPNADCYDRYELPSPGAQPGHVIVDPDGFVWTTGSWANSLYRLDPRTGEVLEIPLPPPRIQSRQTEIVGSYPWDLLLGEDGGLYFTEFFDATVDRLDLSLVNGLACTALDASGRNPCIREWVVYDSDRSEQRVHSLAMDREGRLWFTQDSLGPGPTRSVGFLTTDRSHIVQLPPLATSPSHSPEPPTDSASARAAQGSLGSSLDDDSSKREVSELERGSGAGIAIDPMTGDVWIAEFWRKRIGRLRRLADMDDSGG